MNAFKIRIRSLSWNFILRREKMKEERSLTEFETVLGSLTHRFFAKSATLHFPNTLIVIVRRISPRKSVFRDVRSILQKPDAHPPEMRAIPRSGNGQCTVGIVTRAESSKKKRNEKKQYTPSLRCRVANLSRVNIRVSLLPKQTKAAVTERNYKASPASMKSIYKHNYKA